MLILYFERELGGQGIKFYPGVSYRHLLVVKEALLEKGRGQLKTVPPHNIVGMELRPHLPRGRGSGFLRELIQKSKLILENREINEIRIDLGENPANMIWPWGQGKALRLPSFREKFNLTGALISAVDLLRGIAVCIGLEVITVPGATGSSELRS